MFNCKKKQFNNFIKIAFFLIIFAVIFIVLDKYPSQASPSYLSGKILLQVEENGEAWYINPLDDLRYYLGRPNDAFNLMRSLGLGVSNKDISYFLNYGASDRLSGRILMQVEDKGQAYYVKPDDLKLYYLGRPSDAFDLMKSLGLGISNNDLNKISLAKSNENTLSIDNETNVTRNYSFRYENQDYSLNLNLNTEIYNYYLDQEKVFSYNTDTPPIDLRDSFYSIFFEKNIEDDSIINIINEAKLLNPDLINNDDALAEFLVSLVQFIPYDFEKVYLTEDNENPYFPYETLYLNKGVCSDKTFLALDFLRELGYGTAILDFPEANHSALGVSCPLEYSINNSGYCFVETTNYFPFGIVPKKLNEGQAKTDDSDAFSDIFSASYLGKMEVFQKREGKTYLGVEKTVQLVAEINELSASLDNLSDNIDKILLQIEAKDVQIADWKEKMNTYLENDDIASYNDLVAIYNTSLPDYDSKEDLYNNYVDEYNEQADNYNSKIKYFYQK